VTARWPKVPEVPAEVPEMIAGMLLRYIEAYASVMPQYSPFREMRAAAPEPRSASCYEAPFGMVHVRPGCRCRKGL
jgi:hypothetical protein